MVKRLISCTKSDFEKMTPMDLKLSIRLSEGRTILGQSFNGMGNALLGSVTNPELEAAFGADILLLNGYSLDEKSPMYGVKHYSHAKGMQILHVKDIKELVNRPVGIYLECVNSEGEHLYVNNFSLGRTATKENFEKALEEGADFIILGANPSMNAKIDDIVAATKVAGKTVKGKIMIFSGKWEDGVYEKVLGDPMAKKPAKEFIDELMDAGTDVIDFPAPGSRQGITVDMIRDLVEYVHKKDADTMTMSFIDGSVEGADVDTIRALAIRSRETGADIHAIGDAGLAGSSLPENIYQLSLSVKGRRLTWERMAGNNR
ncbi:MAG TPA: hypothetical protein DCK95_09325 [Anaerolineaceae bacterium]|nr:hypothetical protein [Anaerolineaceae bacterium]